MRIMPELSQEGLLFLDHGLLRPLIGGDLAREGENFGRVAGGHGLQLRQLVVETEQLFLQIPLTRPQGFDLANELIHLLWVW